MPAFDLRLTVPAAPTVTGPEAGGTLRPGEPWNAAWTGADGDGFVEVAGTLDGTDLVASCRGLTGSSLTIPAELTAQWPATIAAAS